MKNDNIRIKQKKSDFLLFGFAYLFLILAGIFLIGLPFLSISPANDVLTILFLSIGIIFTVCGGILYGILIYRGVCPKDALIITNKGFTNRIIGGKEGVYVEWVNVASMKVFGLTKAPMLGLTLADSESYLASLSGKAAKDARDNMELGLPIIAISQKDVFLKIPELKNLFSRMIKGAISWEQYAAHNKKAELRTEEVVELHFEEQADELTDKKRGKNDIFENAATTSPLFEETPNDIDNGTEETTDPVKTRELDPHPAKDCSEQPAVSEEILELDMDEE